MALMTESERDFARAISRLAYCNPFLPERIEYEKEALGDQFVEVESIWSKRCSPNDSGAENVDRILDLVEKLATSLRGKLWHKARASAEEKVLYEDLVLFLLYHRYRKEFREYIHKISNAPKGLKCKAMFYIQFAREFDHFHSVPGFEDVNQEAECAHLFACFFQIWRAFVEIFNTLIGRSLSAAKLRAAIWQSAFSHDLRRYRRGLYLRMGDVATLVTGPSGTGKELVARIIGHSRYIPFQPKTQMFEENFTELLFTLNLSALSPTLIESELFGHRRGAFTGALQDRMGWFEVCPSLGSVFLDEIGETSVEIQVKLLRVIESRAFQPLGDTTPLYFQGKIIAATNRDLAHEIAEGRFRSDLYYRLCSDIIETPSLSEQLRDSTDFLPTLVRHVAMRLAGEEEAGTLAEEILDWIEVNLGADYGWPGNFRELEQCARNILIRKSYTPVRSCPKGTEAQIAEQISQGALTAEELLSRYCAIVYTQTGSYQETARRLELDHRTVRKRVQQAEEMDKT